MSELSFDDFCKQAIGNSPILTDAQILGPEYTPTPVCTDTLLLYCHRIACYCARDLLGKIPYDDDGTWIDAVQECTLHAPRLIDRWRLNPTHQFATYASASFRRIISNYVWTQLKGGMGRHDSKALGTEELPNGYYAGEEDYSERGCYEDTPFGLRDPFEEVSAMQTAERLLSISAYDRKINKS